MKYIQRIDKSLFLLFSALWFGVILFASYEINAELRISNVILMVVVALLGAVMSALVMRKRVTIGKTHLNFGMKKYKWSEIQKISYQQFVRVNEAGVFVDQYLIFEMTHRQKALSLKGLEGVTGDMLQSIKEVHPGVALSDDLHLLLTSNTHHLSELAKEARDREQEKIDNFYVREDKGDC